MSRDAQAAGVRGVNTVRSPIHSPRSPRLQRRSPPSMGCSESQYRSGSGWAGACRAGRRHWPSPLGQSRWWRLSGGIRIRIRQPCRALRHARIMCRAQSPLRHLRRTPWIRPAPLSRASLFSPDTAPHHVTIGTGPIETLSLLRGASRSSEESTAPSSAPAARRRTFQTDPRSMRGGEPHTSPSATTARQRQPIQPHSQHGRTPHARWMPVVRRNRRGT